MYFEECEKTNKLEKGGFTIFFVEISDNELFTVFYYTYFT